MMPGVPPEGGDIYVVERGKPAGTPELALYLPVESSFDAVTALRITGSSTASSVYDAAVIPGQGTLPVSGGRFEFVFDPRRVHEKAPSYDVEQRNTGRPELGDSPRRRSIRNEVPLVRAPHPARKPRHVHALITRRRHGPTG